MNNFWSDVVWSSDQVCFFGRHEGDGCSSSISSFYLTNIFTQLLHRFLKFFFNVEVRKAEISQLEMALLVKDQVFWLQVSMNEVKVMQMLDGKHNFCKIKLSSFFLEVDFLVKEGS
jgi:hypothetical protein